MTDVAICFPADADLVAAIHAQAAARDLTADAWIAQVVKRELAMSSVVRSEAKEPIDTSDPISIIRAYLDGRLSWVEYRNYQRTDAQAELHEQIRRANFTTRGDWY